MISPEQLNNALQGFMQRYFKEKAESEVKLDEVFDLIKEDISELRNKVKVLEDARERQIKLNSEFESRTTATVTVKPYVPPKPKSLWERYFKG